MDDTNQFAKKECLYEIPDIYKNPSYEGHPKINIYTCNTCNKKIVSVDVDDGVTPFTIGCTDRQCIGHAYSSFYPRRPKDMPPNEKPTIEGMLSLAEIEWYRPRVLPKDFQDHFLKGGLDKRPRTNAKPVCHKD